MKLVQLTKLYISTPYKRSPQFCINRTRIFVRNENGDVWYIADFDLDREIRPKPMPIYYKGFPTTVNAYPFTDAQLKALTNIVNNNMLLV